MKKALLFLLFAVLALVLTAVVAIVLVLKIALAPSADEWSAHLRLGPATVEIGVPTAMRLATSSWFVPWFAGRTFDTAHGPVRVGWNEASNTLELDCAPCSIDVPALGGEPLRVAHLRLTARRDAGLLNGLLEARPGPARTTATVADDEALRARWEGRLSQKNLQVDLQVIEAPIARWYAVFAPGIPELGRARIDGSLAARVQLTLPTGRFSVQPRLSQFGVEGLASEAMLGARSSCGPSARLAPESWLARAVLSAEDQRFFSHPGFDLVEMLASLDGNLKAAQVERGGSTLTQQLARLLVTGGERSLERKLRELLYAVEMEETLGKVRILQLYLDNAPWGADLCGAEAAARRYFKRAARNLEPAQAVWLAAMLTNPQAAVERWRRSGELDPDRLKAVAEGIRGISRSQRDALLRTIASARFAAP